MSFGTKLEEAVSVKNSANRLQEMMSIAKIEIDNGNYSRVIACQKDSIALGVKIADLAAHGYGMEILGPLVVEAFGIDPAKTWDNFYVGQYVGFQTAVSDFISYRSSVQADLYATARDDANGYIEYKNVLSPTIVTELKSKIDSILVFELS